MLRLAMVAGGVTLLAACDAGLERTTGPRAEPGAGPAEARAAGCGYLGSGGCARDTVPTGLRITP